MPVGHDVRDFAEHKCGLSPVRLAGPHRLVHAEEFRREGGMELSVRVANDMSLVQRAGERRQLGPVAPPQRPDTSRLSSLKRERYSASNFGTSASRLESTKR